MNLPSIVVFFIVALTGPIPSPIRAPAVAVELQHDACGPTSYINSKGDCIRRPMRANTAPVGASARCRDGRYSFSESRSGTCSHHGGVAAWL